jgi:peptidoglycan/LPS O-acetylase OafA/YrhL
MTGDTPRKLIDGIQVLRAVAALAVVVYHAGGSIASPKYQGLGWIGGLTGGLDAGVDLFFVISGFVIAWPMAQGRTQRLGAFLRDRAFRIYPLAMLTAAIFLGLGFVIFRYQVTLGDIASSVLLLPVATDPTPIVLWTLKQELLFYMLFAVAILSPRVGLPLIVIWGVASVLISAQSPLAAWALNPHNIQFVCGVAAAYVVARELVAARAAPILALVSGIVFIALAYAAGPVIPTGGWAELSLGLAGFAVVASVASWQMSAPSTLLFLGAASYAIYLIHYLFVSLVQQVIDRVTPGLPGPVALALIVAVATLGGVVYYLLAERPIERWRKSIQRPHETPTLGKSET